MDPIQMEHISISMLHNLCFIEIVSSPIVSMITDSPRLVNDYDYTIKSCSEETVSCNPLFSDE